MNCRCRPEHRWTYHWPAREAHVTPLSPSAAHTESDGPTGFSVPTAKYLAQNPGSGTLDRFPRAYFGIILVSRRRVSRNSKANVLRVWPWKSPNSDHNFLSHWSTGPYFFVRKCTQHSKEAAP